MTAIKNDSLRHYNAIKDVAESRKLPRDIHRKDLTEHDLRTLRKRGPEIPFVWMLHPGGTHLLHTGPVVQHDGDHSFRYPRLVVESFPDAAQGIYAWDGYALRQLASAEEAERFLRLESCICSPPSRCPDREEHPSPCPVSRMP